MLNYGNNKLNWRDITNYGDMESILKIGSIIGMVGMLIYMWSINMFSMMTWEVGWVDPSSAFAESLIRLYDFVWFWLIIVMVFVLVLMIRIVYLFSWRAIYFDVKIINFLIINSYKLFL